MTPNKCEVKEKKKYHSKVFVHVFFTLLKAQKRAQESMNSTKLLTRFLMKILKTFWGFLFFFSFSSFKRISLFYFLMQSLESAILP